MSAPKAIAQMIFIGGKIIRQAFKDAYKQASINSAAARAAAGNAKSEESSNDSITKKTGIALDESKKILNVEDLSDMEAIKKKYEHMFKINDPKDGGSFYIQSKIIRAFERIQIENAENLRRKELEEQQNSAVENQEPSAPNEIKNENQEKKELDTEQNGPEIQETLYQMTNQRTVPNIFINRQHIGGNDSLNDLVLQDKLKNML
ncbi:hypothetical protein BB559_004482 [Furculomyces boomerangus]|uniref:Mitochondrial import inner membrane translocase subunit TIM16 n=2 Tax=Harpellales TaxID=61421 RepID=A0A2T9YEC4_9FUNG|nr:hypothetical protein BB559_007336 [Furculomyces boomerangus]PVU90691.1 hypothetical protein BB559_004488 [Furculomyces boomerangus]PVU90692.1 hypothetical protein BB559_004482 [Furculomyces boomerangus]PWA01581.1 hypothetical protein BB558_002316 [Smittium angustum]